MMEWKGERTCLKSYVTLIIANKSQLDLFDTDKFLIPNQSFPGLIKYMGSKTKIIDYVVNGINDVYQGRMVVDLFVDKKPFLEHREDKFQFFQMIYKVILNFCLGAY